MQNAKLWVKNYKFLVAIGFLPNDDGGRGATRIGLDRI